MVDVKSVVYDGAGEGQRKGLEELGVGAVSSGFAALGAAVIRRIRHAVPIDHDHFNSRTSTLWACELPANVLLSIDLLSWLKSWP
jgi:hypothetical protein